MSLDADAAHHVDVLVHEVGARADSPAQMPRRLRLVGVPSVAASERPSNACWLMTTVNGMGQRTTLAVTPAARRATSGASLSTPMPSSAASTEVDHASSGRWTDRAPRAWKVAVGQLAFARVDARAAVVLWRPQDAGDADRSSQLAGQQSESDKAQPLRARERFAADVAAQHAELQLPAVDQHWRQERLERGQSELVVGARGHDRQRDLAAADILDRRLLVIGFALAPAVGDADPNGPSGESLDGVRPRPGRSRRRTRRLRARARPVSRVRACRFGRAAARTQQPARPPRRARRSAISAHQSRRWRSISRWSLRSASQGVAHLGKGHDEIVEHLVVHGGRLPFRCPRRRRGWGRLVAGGDRSRPARRCANNPGTGFARSGGRRAPRRQPPAPPW